MEETIPSNANNKSHRKEVVLLLATLLCLFIFGEVFFRVYYWWLDKPVAANSDELCLKEMKQAKNYESVGYDNFTYKREFEEHPLIGLTNKRNFNKDWFILEEGNNQGEQKPLITFYQYEHYNNQSLNNIEEFSTKKPKKVPIRIALFGDSFTCGAESPLLFNIGYILKELIPKSEVLNFCVVGTGIDTMYARYVLEGQKYSPDVVVFNILVDDLRRVFNCQLLRPNLEIHDGKIVIAQRKWQSLRDFYFNYTRSKYESYFIKHVLWVYNKHDAFKHSFEKGLELFSVMLNDLKEKTTMNNATLIVVPIIQELPSKNEAEIYKRMVELIKEKNVASFDSNEYFTSKKPVYKNQSFFYIAEKDGYGHFSPVGNAIFAQKIKNVLEEKQLVQKTPDYNFAHFKKFELMYLIPDDIKLQLGGNVRALSTFKVGNSKNPYSFNLVKESGAE